MNTPTLELYSARTNESALDAFSCKTYRILSWARSNCTRSSLAGNRWVSETTPMHSRAL